ncbi:MAG: hypothetical protein ABR548_10385 [Actinomycetota bacterium]|nr:hypothetical protein [Actinomycetota bacterium]
MSFPATEQFERPRELHSAVIVGSFRRNAKRIHAIAENFRQGGIDVKWPLWEQAPEFEDPMAGFPRDRSDPKDTSEKQLEQRVLEEGIAVACFVYLANANRYFGQDTTFELGWASALGVPIYTYERMNEDNPVVAHRVNGVRTPQELIDKVRGGACPCVTRQYDTQRVIEMLTLRLPGAFSPQFPSLPPNSETRGENQAGKGSAI